MSKQTNIKFLSLLNLLAYILAAAGLLGLTIYLYPSYLTHSWPSGYDTFGHLGPVEFFTQMLTKHHTFVDWFDQWYTGYHPLLNFPPLAYVGPVIMRLLGMNLNRVARYSVLFAIWLSGWSGYLLGIAITRPDRSARAKLIALVPAVIYMNIPGILSLQLIQGEFPDFFAAALAPLPAAAFVLWLRTQKIRYLALLTVAISIVFFAHGHIATPLALALFVGAWLYDFVGKHQRKKEGQSEKLKPPYHGFRGIFMALLIFVGLTAVWWLPYFVESPLVGSPQIRSVITTPDLLIHLLTRGLKADTNARYLGIAAVLIALLGLTSRKRRLTAAFVGMALGGLFMYAGPRWGWYSKIPALRLVYSERVVPTLAIAIAGLATLAVAEVISRLENLFTARLSKKSVPSTLLASFITIVITLTIITGVGVAVIKDASFIFPNGKTTAGSKDLADISRYLAKQPRPYGARVAFLPSQAPAAYSPVLSGWPIIGGHRVEGSKLAPSIDWIMIKGITARDNMAARAAFNRWNIAYLAINRTLRPKAVTKMERDPTAKKVYANEKYDLFKRPIPGYISPAQNLLIVGNSRYLQETIERSSDTGKRARVLFTEKKVAGPDAPLPGLADIKDNYFDAIVFMGGAAPVGLENIFKNRLQDGAKALVDLDGSAINRFLGVKVRNINFKGTVKLVDSDGKKHVSAASFNNNPWNAVAYEGLDETWLTGDGKALAGIKHVGKGDALFIGYNLFYHAVYKNDNWEKRELVKLFDKAINKSSAADSFSFRPLSIKPKARTFVLNTKAPTTALISSGWSPYWQAYLDNRPIAIQEARHLMTIYLPKGRHKLHLVISNWSWIKIIALVISLVTAAIGIFLITKAKRAGLNN